MTLNGTETRWHFSSTDVPDITVPVDMDSWNVFSGTRRSLLLANNETSKSAFTEFSATSSQNYYAVCAAQYVSPPLPPNVNLGTRSFRAAMITYASVSGAYFAWAAYIYRPSSGLKFSLNQYSTTGSTRAVLQADGARQPTSYGARLAFPAGTTADRVPPYLITQPNDRLVFEFGQYMDISLTVNSFYRVGISNPDIPYSYGYNSDLNASPWISIDSDIYSRKQLTPNASKVRPRQFAPGNARFRGF